MQYRREVYIRGIQGERTIDKDISVHALSWAVSIPQSQGVIIETKVLSQSMNHFSCNTKLSKPANTHTNTHTHTQCAVL